MCSFMLKSRYAEKKQSRYPISLTFENFCLPLLSHLPPLRPPRPPWSFELHPQVKKVRRRLFSVTIWLPSLLLPLPPQFARLFVCSEQQGRPQKPFFVLFAGSSKGGLRSLFCLFYYFSFFIFVCGEQQGQPQKPFLFCP